MTVILCVACGYIVWAEVMMGGFEHVSSFPKTCENMLSGLLEDGQRPHGMLRHELCMCSMLCCTDTDMDTDTGIRQFLKNKNTTRRGHGN